MDTTSDAFCGKPVYNTDTDGLIVGDVCKCILTIDHEGDCLCEHKLYRRYPSHAVDAVALGIQAYSDLKRGQQ